MKGFSVNRPESSRQSIWKQLLSPFLQSGSNHDRRFWSGRIDVATPTSLVGWAFHRLLFPVEVRLLLGPHLITKATVNLPRPDVELGLGVNGSFGFLLEIPGDLPLIDFVGSPTVLAVALDADSGVASSYQLVDQMHNRQLELCLSPKFRGLRGHFDGLTACNSSLSGWALRSRVNSQPVEVYLNGLSATPIPLLCNQLRPDLELLGLHGVCGFTFPLDQLPPTQTPIAGEVWVSFDDAGMLRLPQVRPWFLP
jgi:hypothetical protein